MTHNPAIAIGVVQLCLALAWVAYAIYLPLLATQAGIARAAVPWLLVMDQAVFALADWASGAHADKAMRAMRRLAPLLVGVTAVSTLSFIAMPWLVTALGPAGFVLFALLWVVTTAALRAPPMALLGNYAPPAVRPVWAATGLLGLGLAGAVAPYLALQLRGVDPRWPFLIAGLAVMGASLTLLAVERRMALPAANPMAQRPMPDRPGTASIGWLIAIALCLALGFQAQILALPAQIARFAGQDDLDYFMPIFWIGFCVAMWPAAVLCSDARLRQSIAIAALIGAIASAAATAASGAPTLVASHLIAGAAWGVMFTGLLTVAFQRRNEGWAGQAAGIVFGAIAGMAALRIAALALGWPKAPGTSMLVAWIGTIGWMVAALALAGGVGKRLMR